MTLQLIVNYPDTFPDAVGRTREQFELEAKWAMAVKLFEMNQLSSGMAASLIGVDRVTFLLKLADYGVNMIDLPDAELLSDLANA
jgi:predicted HTH domain antitoxin